MAAKVLMLQCRGFGDAIISTQLIDAMHESWKGVSIDVWASGELVPIFEAHGFVNKCYTQDFPVIRRHGVTLASFLGLPVSVWRLRRRRYDLCLNLVGDMRENFLTWLVGARQSWTVEWQEGQPFRNLIRPGLYRLIDHVELMPREERNIYSAYKLVAKKLGCDWPLETASRGGYGISLALGNRASKCRIGIHPLAGSASKEWPFNKWNQLLERILESSCEVVIFGAPGERRQLEGGFSRWKDESRVSIETHGLNSFLGCLKNLTAFIGLDSFGIHAAYAVGIPSILLNGANPPDAWAPPGTRVVGEGRRCEHYPCYNRPKCIGTATEYICINDISVSRVLDALNQLVGSSSSEDEKHSQSV